MPHHAAPLAEAITADYFDGRLATGFKVALPSGEGTWEGMPEVDAVASLQMSGVGEREVRRFLTFIVAMDRARPSMPLWKDGVSLLRSDPGLFEPFVAAAIPLPVLRERLRQSRVSQRHRPDSKGWQTIARSLASGEGPVAHAVENGVGDAKELVRDLRTRSAGKPRYPLLKGPKIAPLWVRMLAVPGGADIANIASIPVPVDVHIRRVTENLGISDTHGMDMAEATPVIQSAWRDALAGGNVGGPPGIAGTCAGIDPALWAFGKYGCKHCEDEGRRIPVSRACESCRFTP